MWPETSTHGAAEAFHTAVRSRSHVGQVRCLRSLPAAKSSEHNIVQCVHIDYVYTSVNARCGNVSAAKASVQRNANVERNMVRVHHSTSRVHAYKRA